MNLDTVLKCAQIAADHRQAVLGYVDDDILELLAELTPAPAVQEVVQEPEEVVAEEPVAEPVAEPAAEPVAEPVAEPAEDAPAE